MKAIILAGGIGSRLRSNKPKCMTTIPGDSHTIIQNQVGVLNAAGISDITVIVGHKFYMVMEHVNEFTEMSGLAPVKFVLNSGFNYTNTSKSLLQGLRTVGKTSHGVVFMNGDVIFELEAIDTLIDSIHENESISPVDQSSILVCNTARVAEEEIKYTTDESGRVLTLSKQVPQDVAEGEAVGINFIHRDHVGPMIDALFKCDDQDYFERAFEYIIEDGKSILTVVPKTKCVEIDFQADLDSLTTQTQAE